MWLAWLLLSTLTQIPHLCAWFLPPAGTRFLGFFYYVDDQYNYLSYVEQAERGAFFFEHKLVLDPHAASLVNLEWWFVGRLSRLVGDRPFLAYRLLALGAGFALLAAIDRFLRSAGLSAGHRFPALLLVGLGGGLGGLAWRLGLLPLSNAVDLTTGAFPIIELLANPHFLLGTALLAWSLWRLTSATTLRERAVGVVLGTILGLVRPYDLLLLVLVRFLGVLAFEPRSRWGSSLWPLLGMFPVVGYDAWVFYVLPFYGIGLTYVAPSLTSLGLALGPAIALAGLAWGAARTDVGTRQMTGHLALWAASALALVVFRPVGFALQFLVGAAAPLLALGALGLSRFPRHLTLLTAGLFCPTAGIALGLVLSPNPRWYAPAERVAVVEALRPLCRPGEIVMAPADIGLLAIGRTACNAYVSHPAAPGYLVRAEEVRRFYDRESPTEHAALLDSIERFPAASPAERRAFLDRAHARFLILPGDAGQTPVEWLGEGTAYRLRARIGQGLRAMTLYRAEMPAVTR